MSRWMGVVAALVVALVLAPHNADANRWSLHATGSGVVGYTDNVQGQPVGVDDLFYEVAPGALFTLESPRTIHELSYEFRYIGYLDQSDANSYSNQAAYRGFFLLSPRAEVALLATLHSGETNTFRPGDGQVAVDLIPSGTNYTNLETTQILRYQLDPAWRLTETASAGRLASESAGMPIDGVDLGATLGGDRSWKKDGLGLTIGANYIVLSQPDLSSHQINTSAELSWRRDLSEEWTSMVRGGLTSIVPILDQPGDPQRSTVHSPTIAGSLAWFPIWGSLRIEAQHMVGVNMFLAQNNISDEVTLTSWLPIPYFVEDPLAPVFTSSAGLGVRRSQLVDLSADDREIAHSFSADLALHYSPQRSGSGVTLRYTFFRQTQDSGPAVPSFPSFTRNAVMLEFHGRWPGQPAATYPQRDPLRVDGSDITPMSAEQAAEPAARPQ